MSEPPRSTRARSRRPRRRAPRVAPALLLLVAVAGLVAGLARGAGDDDAAPPAPRVIQLTIDGRPVLRLRASEVERASAESLQARLKAIPERRDKRRDRAVVRLKTDYRATSVHARRIVREGGDTVAVVERRVSAQVFLPVVKQRLRNNCESAALAMLLLARGRQARQLELQKQLPRSGPLDPRPAEDGGIIWGDPRKGYVGRPEGGGTSGGYGVYEAPVAALAARHGVTLRNLSGRPAARVYDALHDGRPVMVWIGLSDGPFKTWQTPEGDTITGNFGEHTVVFTGIRGNTLSVNDPLSGQRLTWTKPQFELMWKRLGERALAA